MPLNVKILSGPIVEPITVAMAKKQLRLDADFTDDDTLVTVYVTAARQLAEKITRRAFFNQRWRRTLDSFPLAGNFDTAISPADRANWITTGGIWNRQTIDLPGGPVARIVSISYRDATTGSIVTLTPAQFFADLSSEPCRLTPSTANGFAWPFNSSILPGSVQIDYEPASYISSIVEPFTVPADPGPYVYTLQGVSASAPLTAVASILDSQGAPVNGWTNTGASLTLAPANAGQALTATYCVGNFPAMLQVALLMLVEHFYRNPGATTDLRLSELPLGVQAILSSEIIEWTDYRPC